MIKSKIQYIYYPCVKPFTHNWLFRNSKLYRDIRTELYRIKFKRWCRFMRKHKLWVNITDEYLEKMLEGEHQYKTFTWKL